MIVDDGYRSETLNINSKQMSALTVNLGTDFDSLVYVNVKLDIILCNTISSLSPRTMFMYSYVSPTIHTYNMLFIIYCEHFLCYVSILSSSSLLRVDALSNMKVNDKIMLTRLLIQLILLFSQQIDTIL